MNTSNSKDYSDRSYVPIAPTATQVPAPGLNAAGVTLTEHQDTPVHNAADANAGVSAEVNEHARLLWERSPLGYMVVEQSGRIVALNIAAQSILGAILGDLSCERHIDSLCCKLNDQQRASLLVFLQAARGAECEPTIELDLCERPGVARTLQLHLLSVCPATIVLGVTDITAKRRLEQQSAELKDQLRHLQRLELINDISAGVAHDFNNVLQVIGAFTGALKFTPDMPERALEAIEEILSATERGAALTRRLLEFSRKSRLSLQSVDMANLAQHCIKIVSRSLPREIECEVEIVGTELNCRIDATLIQQALLNLLLNARDAMPLGGRLRLVVDRRLPPSVQPGQPQQAAGEYICISVCDTGVGIPEDLRERIFEPFFTTKLEGAGTGLGLALVRGIVADHRGTIDMESAVGKGTTFRVYLPTGTHKVE